MPLVRRVREIVQAVLKAQRERGHRDPREAGKEALDLANVGLRVDARVVRVLGVEAVYEIQRCVKGYDEFVGGV